MSNNLLPWSSQFSLTSTEDDDNNLLSSSYSLPEEYTTNLETNTGSTNSPESLFKLLGGGNSNSSVMLNPTKESFWSNALGSYGTDGKSYTGWATPALNIGKGLFDSWMALKTLGLAEDTFESNKELAWANYDAQKNTTNASLQWLEDSRNAFNGAGTSDLSQYMIS